MTKSIQSAFAALLVASAIIGGASSAFADSGDYHSGVSAQPLFTGRTAAAVSGTTAEVAKGGEGDYYVGATRNPVDVTRTGSIVKGVPPIVVPRSGDYYDGARR